jgi:predicted transcriptional regulator
MSAKADHIPMMAHAEDSGDGPMLVQSALADLRAGIDRGLAQARAGIGYDLDEVLADMDRKIAAHQK